MVIVFAFTFTPARSFITLCRSAFHDAATTDDGRHPPHRAGEAAVACERRAAEALLY